MKLFDTTYISLLTDPDFQGLDEATALALSKTSDSFSLDLFALAKLTAPNTVTTKIPQQRVFSTCAIINAKSGKCSEDCTFCAQSSHYQTGVKTHPLISYGVLAKRAEELVNNGVTRFGIVTSGHGLSKKEYDELCTSVSKLTSLFPQLRFCASLGKLNEEQAIQLKQAGFTRYHHNLETSASYYPVICTTHPYEDRLATVRTALKVGMEVCSGGIFGLGESWEQRIEMALTLRKEKVTVIPINFLNAIPHTPLENQPKLHPLEALRTIAIFRLLLPKKDLIICGGREHVLGKWQPWLTSAGANGLMVGNYLTTKGNSFEDDRDMLRGLGVNALNLPI